VLPAFQQVEDPLSSLRVLSQENSPSTIGGVRAQRDLDIATARYQTGLDPYLNVITDEIILLSDQQTLATLRVNE
jgi:outer membrane protein TolC